jgi:hypothetical protein
MNQFDDEFAALQNRRVMENLHESPVTDRIVDAADATGVVAAVGSALIPPCGAVLVPVGIGASVLGALGRALQIGKPTAKKMVEDLESATDSQVKRIWSRLEKDTERQNEFEARLNSNEAKVAMLNEFFHGLRTSDPAKHARLAVVTVNSVFEGDLGGESLDTLMRAAVELKEHDIKVLGSIYEMQKYLFSPAELRKEYSWRIQAINSLWDDWWRNQKFSSFQGINGMAFNSSCARLQSAGLIASIGISSFAQGSTMHNYELLPEGLKFYERLQEIAVK